MISFILTAYKEEKTIARAIMAILNQEFEDKFEILVTAPDDATLNEAAKFALTHKNIHVIKDPGQGKPTALNFVIPQAKGEIIILTDGDVYCKNAAHLIEHFKNARVGAVTGRPVSLDSKNSMMGYWSQLLLDSAHKLRKARSQNNRFILCSGYLFAMRKNLYSKIPPDILDDAFISKQVWSQGYKIDYEERAKVFIKNPSSFSDWLKQKKRNMYGEFQFKKYKFSKIDSMRSLKDEISYGWQMIFVYPQSIKEVFWTFVLFGARAYSWISAFIDLKFKKKSMKKVWLRVESTK